MLLPRPPSPAPAARDEAALPAPSPTPPVPLSLGAPRKCDTPQCPASPVEPFEALGDERIELSSGRQRTVAWTCACGEVRKTLMTPLVHVPAPE